MQVIETLGLMTGRNFDVDPNAMTQKVTLISYTPIAGELAYQILESILSTRGFEMVETVDGNLIKVVQKGQSAEKLEISSNREVPEGGFDNFAIHVVPVEYADANEVSQLLKAVGSQNAVVTVYAPTSTLVITDTADGLRNMYDLLKYIDVKGYDTSMEIFTLEYTRAEELARQITEVLYESGAPRPATRAQARVPVRAARATGRPATQAQPTIIGRQESTLRMVADERLNALIVVATDLLMEQVRYLIDQLDTPTPYEANNTHFVPLLNADAKEVEEALRSITGTTPRRANQGGGGAQASEVQPFEKTVTITAYEPSNALIIVASPQDFQVLKQIIDQLDVPRRQVMVEAIIMSVTINDRFELSVEAADLASEDSFSLNNVVGLANAIAGGPLALAGIGATFGIIDGTTQIPVPSGVVDGIPSGITLQTIPNVPFLLRALETVTDVEVLSHPRLQTVDNEEASIIVGQEIPVISSLSDVNDRSGFVSRSRIERRDVGVKMTVTPQINEGDYVSLDLQVEVSSPVQSTIGIDPNQVGATFEVSEIKNQVVVGDGQTAIIGGLIREARDRTVSQPPILGDIPLFGWLFRNKSSARNKQNLVILVTPHIIKDGHDLDRITAYQVDEFYRRNIDSLFQKGGFIKKIRQKRRNHNTYRPTERLNPKNNDGEIFRNFGRGDIER